MEYSLLNYTLILRFLYAIAIPLSSSPLLRITEKNK